MSTRPTVNSPGPATKEILRRNHEIHGDERFRRLGSISNGHIYNLRKTRSYRDGADAPSTRRAPPRCASASAESPPLTADPATCVSIPSTSATGRVRKGSTSSTLSTRWPSSSTSARSPESHRVLSHPPPRGPHHRLPLHRRGLPRRQRIGVHQPPGLRAPEQAPHRDFHQVTPPPHQRQRPRRIQKRKHRAKVARPHLCTGIPRPPCRRLPA